MVLTNVAFWQHGPELKFWYNYDKNSLLNNPRASHIIGNEFQTVSESSRQFQRVPDSFRCSFRGFQIVSDVVSEVFREFQRISEGFQRVSRGFQRVSEIFREIQAVSDSLESLRVSEGF